MKFFQKILICLASILLVFGCSKVSAEESAAQTEQAPADTAGDVCVKTVQTADFSMEYCQFGKGDRTLVVLPGLSIQNLMNSAQAIAQSYKLLSEEFTIYLFERRQDMPSSYSVSDMTKDTVAAFRELGLDHITIYGVSYGGMAAMEMAVQYPDLVENIILASTTADLTDEEFKVIDNWIQLAQTQDSEKLYLAFGEALYPKETFEQSRQTLIDAAKTVTEEDLKKFIILAQGMKGFNITDQLHLVRCPVLLIADKQDRLLGSEAYNDIECHLPEDADFQLWMYDGYGHAVYDLAPDLKARLLEYLSSYFRP